MFFFNLDGTIDLYPCFCKEHRAESIRVIIVIIMSRRLIDTHIWYFCINKNLGEACLTQSLMTHSANNIEFSPLSAYFRHNVYINRKCTEYYIIMMIIDVVQFPQLLLLPVAIRENSYSTQIVVANCCLLPFWSVYSFSAIIVEMVREMTVYGMY